MSFCLQSITIAASIVLCSGAAFAQGTTRVSIDSSGLLGSADSSNSDVSFDGRYVAFASDASNLVVGDTNGAQDVFVHDRVKGLTTRVSVDSAGLQADNLSGGPSISAGGRFVAFHSLADNLVALDTNSAYDVFLHDRKTGQTTRVSVSSAGDEGDDDSRDASLSADGRRVAFVSNTSNFDLRASGNFAAIYVHDKALGLTVLASLTSLHGGADGASSSPAISGDGKVVAFSSAAINLVPGDTNAAVDVFVRRLGNLPRTTRVSVNSNKKQGNGNAGVPSCSFDGSVIVFHSVASNLVVNDLNAQSDVFVRDLSAGTTEIVSVDSLGAHANGYSHSAEISADGTAVVYSSIATNLVLGDTNGVEDVFVFSRNTGVTERVSVSSAGVQGSWQSMNAAISDVGRLVSYTSRSRSAYEHIFFRDREAPSLTRTGICPGPITLKVFGGTVGDDVAIAHGRAGYFVKPSPPCQGIELGIEVPVFAVLTPTFTSGQASVSFNAPIGACGITFQAVDVASCKVSNPIVL
jgi:Tol biopolymer transport system component